MSVRELYKRACRVQRELNRLKRMRSEIHYSNADFFTKKIVRDKELELFRAVSELRDSLSGRGHYRGSFLIFSRISKACSGSKSRDKYDMKKSSRHWYISLINRMDMSGDFPESERTKLKARARRQFCRSIPF